MAGNNEDWKDPYAFMWFFPPEDDKHGWVKFGFGNGFPQGGMNDQGVFWDGTACPYLPMPLAESAKEKYAGPLMEKVMATCSDIEEAKAVFGAFYCEDQYHAQYLVGDAEGGSMIVEGDNILTKEGDYQILTNFYHSHPELGGYPCWRYQTAAEMLSTNYALSPYFVGSVLDATHQEGKYPTQYSTIYDLKRCVIYLFYNHHFDEFIKIDLTQELKKGARHYHVPGLFSKVRLNSPYDGEQLASTSVAFRWEGKPGHRYEVSYSTDPLFRKSKHIDLAGRKSKASGRLPVIYLLAVFLPFVVLSHKNGRVVVLVLAMLALAGFPHCGKEDSGDPETTVTAMSESVSGLLPDTTYYWKIKACITSCDDFHSETRVRSFRTGKY
jgi:hypothetical protein